MGEMIVAILGENTVCHIVAVGITLIFYLVFYLCLVSFMVSSMPGYL